MLVFIALAFPWYIFMIKQYGNSFIHEFFYNDHIRRFLQAEHKANDTWYFYPLSMCGCLFPWSLFVPGSLFLLIRRQHLLQKRTLYFFLVSWIGVVFIIFQVAHSKLTSYILPLFPALALLMGDYLYNYAITEDKKSIRILSIMTWCMLLLVPIALSIGLTVFTGYISVKTPIYIFILLFSCLLLIILVFILRGEFFKVIASLVLIIHIMLLTIPFIRDDIEPYFSSRVVGEYLVKKTDRNAVILCSKPFVRGVRYFTNRKVAVISDAYNNFFSPHPIPFLDSDEKVNNFLRSQPITYCVLKKSYLVDLSRIAISIGFKIDVLNVIGNEYVAKVESH